MILFLKSDSEVGGQYHRFEVKIPLEKIDVYFKVKNIGNSSITKIAEIYRADSDVLLTTGEMISVNFDPELGKSKRVPDKIRSVIENFEKSQ